MLRDDRKPVILTIDDERAVRQSIAAFLEDSGFFVLEAENGRDGIAVFREKKPDLVLVDLRMPEMDGLELLSVLTQESPETPTIVVSGTGALHDAIEALRRGAWDYVTKPIHDMAVLQHALEKSLEQARLIRENRLYREHLEDEVSRRTQELEQARDDAEEASKAKTQFLANMSHELRTPLNGIIGLTDLLVEGSPSEEQREYLNMVRQAGRELLAIVDNLLDMSSIEAGRMVLREATFSIRDTLSELFRVLEIQARWKNLDLTFSIAPDVPNEVSGDAGRMKQVVSNLVVNAIKYTERGKVNIAIATLPKEKGDDDGSIRLSFIVSDTGVGISHQKFAQVFEPFALAESFMTKKYGGAGLGLAIAREIARKMGGDITVESSEGKGSHFTFTAVLGGGGVLVDDDGKGLPRIKGVDAPLQILLAEDDVINQKLTTYFFEKQGHSVVSVTNGIAALEALAKGGFDLVLMDIQMPDMDGVEATKRIRSARSGTLDANIPVIAMTAHVMSGDKERFLAAGMNEYIAKPVDFNQLVKAVEKALASRK